MLRSPMLRRINSGTHPGRAPTTSRCADATNRPRAADTYAAAHPAYGHITIFGDASVSDPYDAPMIGLAVSTEEGFRDDATVRPVRIRDHSDAVISDLTGPFGARLKRGGLVISWSDGKQTVGVLGRGYRPEREAELIALADRVTVNGSRAHLPSADLPESYMEVFDGDLGALSTLTIDPDFTYLVIANKGELTLDASVKNRAEAEAIRFLSDELRPTTLDGTRMLVGPILTVPQSRVPALGGVPSLVRWQVDEGVTFNLKTVGHRPSSTLDLEQLKRLATTLRRQSRSEWEQTIRESDGCYGELGGGRAAASGTHSGSSPAPGATATTAPTIGTPPVP